MSLSDPFVIIVSCVFLSLIAVGIITILVMKKVNAPENVRSVTSVIVVFCGLIFAGFLVYVVTISMTSDVMNIRNYKEYTLESPDSSHKLLVKEYNSFKKTGFEIYAYGSKDMLADIETELYLPFAKEEYKTEWDADTVSIYYTYQNSDDGYICKCCKLDLKNNKLISDEKSELDLSKKEEQSAVSAA